MSKIGAIWAAGFASLFVFAGACGTSDEAIPASDDSSNDAAVVVDSASSADGAAASSDADAATASDSAVPDASKSDSSSPADASVIGSEVCDGGASQAYCAQKATCVDVSPTGCGECEANAVPCPVAGAYGFVCKQPLDCLSASKNCDTKDDCGNGQVCAKYGSYAKCAPCIDALAFLMLECKGGGTCQTGGCK